MTNNEMALVAILCAATLIFLALLYYFYVIIPIRNEQKAASKETESPIDFNEASDDFIPIQKNQLN